MSDLPLRSAGTCNSGSDDHPLFLPTSRWPPTSRTPDRGSLAAGIATPVLVLWVTSSRNTVTSASMSFFNNDDDSQYGRATFAWYRNLANASLPASVFGITLPKASAREEFPPRAVQRAYVASPDRRPPCLLRSLFIRVANGPRRKLAPCASTLQSSWL